MELAALKGPDCAGPRDLLDPTDLPDPPAQEPTWHYSDGLQAGPRYTEKVTPLLAIGAEPLDLARIAAALAEGEGAEKNGADGAIVTFLGLVRNHNLGRSVRYLEYEAYEPLALKTFERIAREIADRWPSARLALHHRVGKLEIGEASVAIATRSPHRGDAYAACRYAIERVKQIAPDLEARVLRRRRRLD